MGVEMDSVEDASGQERRGTADKVAVAGCFGNTDAAGSTCCGGRHWREWAWVTTSAVLRCRQLEFDGRSRSKARWRARSGSPSWRSARWPAPLRLCRLRASTSEERRTAATPANPERQPKRTPTLAEDQRSDKEPIDGAQNGTVPPAPELDDGEWEPEGPPPPAPIAQALAWDFLWPRGLLLVVAAIWGTNFATVKFIGDADSLDVSAGAFARFGIAALAMLPFTIRALIRHWPWSSESVATESREHPSASNNGKRSESAAAANGTTATLTSSRDTRAGRAEFLGRAFLLGTIVFAGYFSQAVGLIETDANKSAFLCSLTVVLVPFLEWTLFRKRVQLRMWASAALAVLGVGLLELDETTMTTVYDVWSFMQAVFFGAGFMMVESLTRDYPGRPLQVASINLTVVALYSAAWYAVSSLMGGSGVDWGDIVRQVAENGPAVAGALLYTGLVTTATAVILQTIAISRVSAEETSVIFCLEPLFAVAFTAALLGESMSLKGGVGGALILAAVLINQALNPEFQQRFRQLRHSEKEQAETQESRDAVGSVNGHEQQRRR